MMGGAVCQVIIKAHFKQLFEDENIQLELDEHPRWKRKVNDIIAKDYSVWTDKDYFTLVHIANQIYLEYN